MREFMTKKNKLAVIAAADRAHGFTMDQTPENNHLYRGIICLLNGFLIFCASYGTIAGLLSAFAVSYNHSALFWVLLILCFMLAFLHFNKFFFNLFYPLIFVVFTYAIMQSRILANSGFQSFVSIMYEEYSSFFELTSSREATVGNTNSYLTITVAALFVGFVLALLINIAVSSHMSALSVILLTAPILQLGIYIGKYPNPIYFVPLVFSYIAIGILGSFTHYRIPQKKQERTEFQVRYKSNVRFASYRANGKALLQTTLVFAVVSLIFLLCFYPVSQQSVNADSAVNSVKNTSDSYVKRFVENGMSGFFNRYESTGGLSEGRLGGVSSVRPDYQTDLRIKFTPYSYETVYLRAFVGVDYTGSSWSDFHDARTNITAAYDDTGKRDAYIDFTTFLESERLADYMQSGGLYALKGKMEVINEDASSDYAYMPYFTSRESGVKMPIYNHVMSGMSPHGKRNTYIYYPAVSEISSVTFPSIDNYALSLPADSDELFYLSSYRDYCYETYTYVPENLIAPIEAVIEKTGYGDDTQESTRLVEQYFLKEYTYSMSPGATPYNRDFIEFFLTQQDSGYCAHFASAATMILRYMGIPARYVEGYIIPASSIAQAERADEPYSDYMTGTSPIGETGVLEVEVTDASAHAWVEVFSDGFGWVPFDPTPPSDDAANDTAGFWDAFSNLFSVTNPQGTAGQLDAGNNNADPFRNFLSSTNHLSLPLLLLFLLLVLFYPLARLLQHLIRYYRQRRAFGRGDYAAVAAYYYRQFFFCLLRLNILSPGPPGEKKHYLSEAEKNQFFTTFAPQGLYEYLGGYELTMPYVSLLEKALYARDGITREEILGFIQMTRDLTKNVQKNKKAK